MKRPSDILWETYRETSKFLRYVEDNYSNETSQEYDDLVYALNEFLEYGFEELPDCEEIANELQKFHD